MGGHLSGIRLDPARAGVFWRRLESGIHCCLCNPDRAAIQRFTNELAERLNRVKVILVVMTLSAIAGIALGFSSQMSMIVIVGLVCIYAILSISDSASITSAVVRNAESRVRGTTMAFHTLVGFVGAFVGPILFGVVLDLAGGGDRPAAWGIAFIGVAVLVLIGPFAIKRIGNAS